MLLKQQKVQGSWITAPHWAPVSNCSNASRGYCKLSQDLACLAGHSGSVLSTAGSRDWKRQNRGEPKTEADVFVVVDIQPQLAAPAVSAQHNPQQQLQAYTEVFMIVVARFESY